MKDKTLKKIILDIVMTFLFLILIDPKNTGMTWHEVIGLSMAALFSFHIILNWAWVKSITQNLFNPKLKTKPKLFYVLNAISLIGVTTIIVTGIQISHVLFPSTTAVNHSLVVWHKWSSYLCLGLFGVHMILHWKFIIDAMRKLFAALKAPRFGKAAMSAGAAVLVASLLYSQIMPNTGGDAKQVAVQQEAVRQETPQRREVYQAAPVETRTRTTSTGSESIKKSSTESSKTSSSNNNNISSSTSSAGDKVTLTDYLSKMFCNGCSKHCSLLSLQCDKGTQQLQMAKIDYQQQYGTTNVK